MTLLLNNIIYLTFVNKKILNFEKIKDFAKKLPSEQEKYLLKIKNDSKIQQSAAARMLLCRVLGGTDRISFEKRQVEGGIYDGTFFSVSHSGDAVAVLFSHSPCGCDIEWQNPAHEKYLYRITGKSGASAYRSWTRAESLFKMNKDCKDVRSALLEIDKEKEEKFFSAEICGYMLSAACEGGFSCPPAVVFCPFQKMADMLL